MTAPPWYSNANNDRDQRNQNSVSGKAAAQRSFREKYKAGPPRPDVLPPLKGGERLPRPYRPDPRSHREPPQRPRPMTPDDYKGGNFVDERGRPVKPNNPYASAERALKKYRGSPALMRRALRPIFRRVPWARIPDFLDWLEKEWDRAHGKYPVPYPNGWRGWYRSAFCPTADFSRSNHWWTNLGSCVGAFDAQTRNCLQGQASTGPDAPPWPGQAGVAEIEYRQNCLVYTESYWVEGIGAWRERRVVNFSRPDIPRFGASTYDRRGPDTVPGWALEPDPNWTRYLPGIRRKAAPIPSAQPSQTPEGYPTDYSDVPGAYNPDLPGYDYGWSYSSDRGVGNLPGTGTEPGTGVAPSNPPRIPPWTGVRSPPDSPTRERKVKTRIQQIGIWLYRALDAISEASEIVDCLYDNLPKDVRDRWEKDRFPNAHWVKDSVSGKWKRVGDTRGLLDNAGQYGIDGADWKAQAVYHNFHKVNMDGSVRCIIKNGLSDAVIGRIQARLPVNAGSAHEAGEIEFAQWLNGLLDDVIG